jgi:hypothetical protein
LKNPDARDTYTTAYEPEKYTEEGNRRRVIANRYWLVGGILLVALFFVRR